MQQIPWQGKNVVVVKEYQHKFHTGIEILRDRGIPGFLRVLRKKIFAVYRADWYVCDLTEQTRTSLPDDRTYHVVDDRFNESVAWMSSLGVPGISNRREIENMRREGHFIYTIMSNNTIGGYIKVGKENVYILDFDSEIRFPPGSAFVIDTFIDEKFRGRKLFHLLISSAKADLLAKGFKKLHCHIRTDNSISSAAYRKNGFRKVGLLTYVRICGKSFFKFPLEYFE